jgi:hypothetical protein
MATKRTVKKKTVEIKRRKPRASVDTMIKRYENKLKRLERKAKLAEIKAKVEEMQSNLKEL